MVNNVCALFKTMVKRSLSQYSKSTSNLSVAPPQPVSLRSTIQRLQEPLEERTADGNRGQRGSYMSATASSKNKSQGDIYVLSLIYDTFSIVCK